MGKVRVRDRQDVTIYRDEFAYVSHPTVAKLHSGDYLVAFNESLVRQPFTHPPSDPRYVNLISRSRGRWVYLGDSACCSGLRVDRCRVPGHYPDIEWRSPAQSVAVQVVPSRNGAQARGGGNGSRRVPRVRPSRTAVGSRSLRMSIGSDRHSPGRGAIRAATSASAGMTGRHGTLPLRSIFRLIDAAIAHVLPPSWKTARCCCRSEATIRTE